VPRVITVNGHTPEIDPSVHLAEDAVVAGRVQLAAGASLWFGVVVRSEIDTITIGVDTNLQDGVVAHADPGFPLTVGARVTVGHRAVIHGCTIGDDVLVGMGAVVLNGAVVGEGAVIGAGAVVTEGTRVPPGAAVVGVPAKVRDLPVPPVPRPNVAAYRLLADWYREATLVER
jgi:carbonic anhydrase/acetyltransferase-like protein (isoleucine patch superfamily)